MFGPGLKLYLYGSSAKAVSAFWRCLEQETDRSGPQPGFRKGEAAGQAASGSPIAAGSDGNAPEPARGTGSLCGLPPDLVDELLAVYFTHVHVSR